MLMRFRVTNFLSFKDEVELSMIPGKTRQHPNHIISGGKSRHSVDILRGAVIYGANASGKSNLIKALDFARDLILEGTKARQTIKVIPFKLDRESNQNPSRFEFEFRAKGKDYLYGFEVTTEKVTAEWLYELKLTTQEPLFERRTSSQGQTNVDFGRIKFEKKKDREFLDFVAMGTRPNQLFLTESMEKNIILFEPVFLWFFHSLVIIFPESRFGISEKSAKDIELLSQFLEKLDTGISGIELRQVSSEKFDKKLQQQILEEFIKNGDEDRRIALFGPRGERLFFSQTEAGEVIAQELVFRHRIIDSKDEITFDADEESDGSIRLMDLIPVLYMGNDSERVFIIDELDRSLHENLCYKLMELFFQRQNTLTQIVVTTHETNLLNFDLLRRDEIWFVDRDRQGSTKLYSLEEFSPRYDRDIQKGYLLGRFGAIPVVEKKHL